ncbi:MAG: hypothetical protein V5A55_12385 [Halovenus sp.]
MAKGQSGGNGGGTDPQGTTEGGYADAQVGRESPTAILGEQSGKQFVKYIVGVFAAVGLGYGVGLLLLDAVGDQSFAIIGSIALFVPILSAPIIAMATGLLTGLRLDTDEQSAAVASAAGAFVGFLVLLIILIIFSSIVTGGGGGGGSPADLLGPLLAFGTGVAVTAGGTAFVVKRIGI